MIGWHIPNIVRNFYSFVPIFIISQDFFLPIKNFLSSDLVDRFVLNRLWNSSELSSLLSILIVLLLITFLVTSADSGILIINTLASGGNQNLRQRKHIIIWGVLFSLLIGVLLSAGGMDALRSVMIIGALPFSVVMTLMLISLLKSLLNDKS